MKTIPFIIFALLLNVSIVSAQSNDDLKHWSEGKSPQEIGNRIAVKFLNTPHTYYGNTHPETPPVQVTYPDVCTWLGGLWFAKVTKNDDLRNQLEKRFTPLFSTEKHLQPKPNHVDNNVFGSVPLELYMQTKQQKYLDLGLFYADTQWNLPENAKPEEKAWDDRGYTWQTRVWIDDMFMITAVQVQAYRATGDRKAWIAVTGYLNQNDELTEVCEGTNIFNSRQYYLDRKRIVGDLHGHAPLLWCATALLR